MFSLVDGGFLIFMLALLGVTIVVFLLRKMIQKLLHPIRKAKVQVANVERQDQNMNAAARKWTSSPLGGASKSGLPNSNLAHAMVENVFYTFYQLEHENKKLKLKIPVNVGGNMAKVGDIGYVTHQDGWILGFEKIGNVDA